MSWYELFFGPTPETKIKHSELFHETDIDRTQCKRVVQMQVLSLGYCRTGTASMHAALTLLGYETWHGFTAYPNYRNDYKLWKAGFETKYFGKPSAACPKLDREYFNKALGHVSAVTDFPPCAFAKELIEAYPDAKVVLVERDVEAWYRSFDEAFIGTCESRIASLITWLAPNTRTAMLFEATTHGMGEGDFGISNAAEFRAKARTVYTEHYATLRQLLLDRGEENRLLNYELGSGWAPLCRFLERDVPPGVSFPWVNEGEVLQEKVKYIGIIMARQLVGSALRVLAPAVLVVVLSWLALGRSH